MSAIRAYHFERRRMEQMYSERKVHSSESKTLPQCTRHVCCSTDGKVCGGDMQ